MDVRLIVSKDRFGDPFLFVKLTDQPLRNTLGRNSCYWKGVLEIIARSKSLTRRAIKAMKYNLCREDLWSWIVSKAIAFFSRIVLIFLDTKTAHIGVMLIEI